MGEMGDEGWKGCGEDIAIAHHFSFHIVVNVGMISKSTPIKLSRDD